MASLLSRVARAPVCAFRSSVRPAASASRALSTSLRGCQKENCGCSASFHSSAPVNAGPFTSLPIVPNASMPDNISTVEPESHYSSPDTTFDDVQRTGSAVAARDYSYAVLGGARILYASGVRLAVLKVISTMSASADVLAAGSMEVNLTSIKEGTTFTAKWRGKPVFIRHRTADEIAKAQNVEATELKDPQKDDERVKDPAWLVVMGVCTHLGCVPVSGQGDYGGWFCPCHGSHYDLSGRIRKGPAPLNLEVPTYKFLDDKTVLLG